MALHRAGQFDEAGEIYRAVLERRPDSFNALNLYGLSLHQLGRSAEAVEYLERAIEVQPDTMAAHSHLAAVFCDLGRVDEGVACYRRALDLEPENISTLCDLAATLRDRGDFDEALSLAQKAAKTKPAAAAGWQQQAQVYLAQENGDAASKAAQRAVECAPDDPNLRVGLGLALALAGRFDEARTAYQEAVRLDPSYGEAKANLASLIGDGGDLDAAITAYDAIVDENPDHEGFRWNRALLLLARGDFREGFAEYARRSNVASRRTEPLSGQPWKGEALDGRTILVTAEQGLGDMVQFVRLVPMLKARGATVWLEAYQALTRLFEFGADVDRVVPFNRPLDGYDFHVPMMNLAHHLDIDLKTLPAAVPYLSAPPNACPPLPVLDDATGHLSVGLCWSSAPGAPYFRMKSCGLAALTPLFDVPDVTFYSLQVGVAAAELAGSKVGKRVVDISPDLVDLAATASAMTQLDLVISIDTVVAHLAGALGRPAWTLLAHAPDWRWMRGRADSPWYPTMRLFRQSTPRDWAGPVAEMAAALRDLADKKASKRKDS